MHSYTEPHFAYSDAVFDIPDGADLFGYFQSQRYFDGLREPEIRESYSFKCPVIAKADAAPHASSETWRGATPVSLHVRRGDYLHKPDYHPVCEPGYYDRCARRPGGSLRSTPRRGLLG